MNTNPAPAETPVSVLLVDDDPAVLWALRRTLEEHGFEVDAATSIAQARSLVGEEPRRYSAAVLDLELGDGNGGELLRELQLPEHACCALVLSGYAAGAVVQQMHERGAVRVLQKPIGTDELITAIRGTHGATEAYRTDLGAVSAAPVNVHPGEALSDAGPNLTDRERDVLNLLRRGLSTKLMASELGLTERTIKFHVGNLLRKFEARSRIDLLAQLSK